MRVLVVHNRYRSGTPSGENLVVDNDIEQLRSAGVDVLTHVRSSDEIDRMSPTGKALVPLRPIWSPTDVRAVRRTIARHQPDVLALHNPTPLVSMGVVRAAADLGVPTVQTVHNHRHTCVKGTYLRDGHDCRDCLGHRFPWPAVLHGCYRDSRLQSLPMATAQAVHRGTRDLVATFIALNPDIRAALVEAGVPESRVAVKPNTVPDPGPAGPVGGDVLFVGRLSEEKGVLLLLDAWEAHPDGAWGELVVVGDGPLRSEVAARAARRTDVRVTGLLDAAGVDAAMSAARAVVVPSTWTEAFPMVVLEAMARGRPVLASRLGGLPEIVTDDVGWVVPPSAAPLADALAVVASSPGIAAAKGAAARQRYDRSYHPDVVTRQLISIYAAARLPG